MRMIRAYDRTYLEKARTSLGRAFDFVVHDLGMDLDVFAELFSASEFAARFEAGDPAVVAGMSGVELSYSVLEASGASFESIEPRYAFDRSEEYWTGWAAAYYQWARSVTFSNLFSAVPASQMRNLYNPYHEMDIRQFVDCVDEMYRDACPGTRLKERRLSIGLTQRELAEASGVPLRTLQQYEQRQKDINGARAEYVVSLAGVLCCEPRDLLENIPESA